MAKKRMLINLRECTGCGLCQIACKDEHVGNGYLPWSAPQPDTGHFWIKVHSQERGQIPKVAVTYTPLLCVHCENAPCMKVCPDQAITRTEEGLVWISPEKCSGCRLCQPACPYDAIYFNERLNVAQKCTLCAHRIGKGLLPRCADLCPRDAILFADEDDAILEQLRPEAEALHAEYGTRPRVEYVGLPRPFVAGTVVDAASAEVVANVRITASDLFNDRELTALTDGFGDFWLRNLEKGHRYAIKAAKEGYQESVDVVVAEEDRNLGEIRLLRKAEAGTALFH